MIDFFLSMSKFIFEIEPIVSSNIPKNLRVNTDCTFGGSNAKSHFHENIKKKKNIKFKLW